MKIGIEVYCVIPVLLFVLLFFLFLHTTNPTHPVSNQNTHKSVFPWWCQIILNHVYPSLPSLTIIEWNHLSISLKIRMLKQPPFAPLPLPLPLSPPHVHRNDNQFPRREIGGEPKNRATTPCSEEFENEIGANGSLRFASQGRRPEFGLELTQRRKWQPEPTTPLRWP